ncbi:unnamed protein product [Phytophthora fragariaefolia]|uniref:Unnamed protein product n=1 Tax=Phytophthora fragariaefolia TaxID=1490495 RepID=A0A9W6X5D8_9STRA|nr:unnamed protein product [Phytophthora fragariaefolia]
MQSSCQSTCRVAVLAAPRRTVVAEDEDGERLQDGHGHECHALDDQNGVVVAVALPVARLAQQRRHDAAHGEDAGAAQAVAHEAEEEEEELPLGLAEREQQPEAHAQEAETAELRLAVHRVHGQLQRVEADARHDEQHEPHARAGEPQEALRGKQHGVVALLPRSGGLWRSPND